MADTSKGGSHDEMEVLIAIVVLALVGWVVVGVLLRRVPTMLHLAGGRSAPWAHLAAVAGRVAVLTLLVIAALAICTLALRAVATWRTLRSRVAYMVLPPPGFEPTPMATEAFGQHLIGVRRRVLTWLDRPACAVRIQVSNTPDGRVAYSLTVPRRFRGSLFSAYGGAYPGVQLEEPARPEETTP